jgi:hypothetical protein
MRSEYFLGKYRDVFNYTMTTIKGGRYPSTTELEKKFGVELRECKEPDLFFVCEEMKKRFVTHKIKLKIEDATDKLTTKDPLDAIDILKEISSYRAHLVDLNKDLHSFKRDFIDRIDMYEKMKENFNGIESMWPSFNRMLGGGWGNGLFHVIAAFTSVGKSWLLSIIANDMIGRLEADDCIFVISTEMEPKRLARRVDCVKFKIPFVGLRDGNLTEEAEKVWCQGLKDMKDGTDKCADIKFFGNSSIQTVDDILMAIDEHKPKAVIIDGGYRLKSTTGQVGWAAQVEIIDQILAASIKTQIPWVVTTQFGDSAEKGEGKSKGKINAWGMRYAKEWVINPDIVISMRQTPDMSADERMEIGFTKIRDGDGVSNAFEIHWDKSTANYDEPEEPEYDEIATEVAY